MKIGDFYIHKTVKLKIEIVDFNDNSVIVREECPFSDDWIEGVKMSHSTIDNEYQLFVEEVVKQIEGKINRLDTIK